MVRPSTSAWLLLFALPGVAQTETAPEPRPVVAVIGASVSAGFVSPLNKGSAERNASFHLAAALRAIWPREQVDVRSFADVNLFRDARQRGERQVERALRAEPALVLAIDFPFWFGYGGAPGEGEVARRYRLDQQRTGLGLLERLRCPVIVGDYPDMHGADPRMLPAAAIPDAATIAELNARLRAWAAGRDRVRVLPLAAWVASVKKGGESIALAAGKVALPPEKLLQDDDLHATKLGVVLLARRALELGLPLLPDDHRLRQESPALDEILTRAGVDVELAEAAGR